MRPLHASIAALAWLMTAACESASASTTNTTSTPTPTTTSTPTPTSTKKYSTLYCSDAEDSKILELFATAATSAECEAYAMISGSYLTIFAPCTTPCVTQRYQELADAVPDCYVGRNTYDEMNKKQQLASQLLNCSGQTAEKSLYWESISPTIWKVKKPKSAATFGVQSSAPHAATMRTGAWLVVAASSVLLLML